MANYSVHKSPETGNFVVAKKGEGDTTEIVNTFPSEGEANLQVLSYEEQEKREAEAKKAEAKEHKAEAKDTHSGATASNDKPQARHR